MRRQPIGAIVIAAVDAETQAGLIIAVIVERPTCLLCISAKSGVTKLDVVRAIERIGTRIAVNIEKGDRCRICGSTLGPVYSAARPT